MARKSAKTAQEILMEDFQTLVSDTEKLLDDTAILAGDQADELRSKIHDSLLQARETLKLTEDSLRERDADTRGRGNERPESEARARGDNPPKP